MSLLSELRSTLPQLGRVEAIYTAAARKAPLKTQDSDQLLPGTGLATDHHSKRRPGGKRQVTLIQAEHIPAIAALSGHANLDPAALRRNILVSGIPLTALRGRQFRIGDALLEGTELCHPCSRMEALLGPGGYNAMRGMGGLCAKVLEGGTIAPGTPVRAVGPGSPTHAPDDDVDESPYEGAQPLSTTTELE